MKVTVVHGKLADLTPTDLNARYMRHETFAQLVANLRRDGVLTSTPFVWKHPDTGQLEIISGNHRVKAAIEAGITEASWIQCDEPLTEAERRAIQLSHNAITGEDDPMVLAELYERIDSVDLRKYSGLDDEQLGLIPSVDLTNLREPTLDMVSLSFVFLPSTWEDIKKAWDAAEDQVRTADHVWLARYEDHARLMTAIEQTSQSQNVLNRSLAMSYVLDVFMAHRQDLAEGYLNAAHEPTRTSWVPLVTAVGFDEIPTHAAGRVRKALEKAMEAGDVPRESPWKLYQFLADRYLGEAAPAKPARRKKADPSV